MVIASVNPATGERLSEYPLMSEDDVTRAIGAAHEAFDEWRRVKVGRRVVALSAAARILRQKKEDLGRLAAQEVGKVLREGVAEVEKCAVACEYYAEHAPDLLEPAFVDTEARRSYVCYQPLGVLLAIMPWNFPFWQVFRFAAPALAAGNAVLLKHAPSVQGCAGAIEDVMRDAGLPEHLFRNLVVDVDAVPGILANDLVRGVTLTGSTRAGRSVGEEAGSRLKKSVLELGGSDPYVILEDADLHAAVDTCVASRLINAGQSCIAAKRFVVLDGVRDEFERRFTARMESVRMGDPLSNDVDIGPLAREDLRENLHRQVTESVDAGARLLLGGKVPPGPGAFYPPTVLTDVKPGMPAYEEELFGPVASIVPVPDEEAAIRVANDSRYGLGAAVFTGDVARGERIARDELEAGSCFVNTFVRSDPRLPFGGIKESGYGRELSQHGIREFTNVKTVYVA